MTDPAAPRPYVFDTEFDVGGVVVTPSSFRPTKRAYTPAEVDALLAQAKLEARQAALEEVESLQAAAISAIGEALSSGVPALTTLIQTHREQASHLALVAARVIAAGALDRFPEGALQAALEALGQEIDASPRLVIRTGGLDDAVRERMERLCTDAGFSGLVAFRDEPELAVAAFQLEWADGRAEFDPAAVYERMSEALASALAAEAGHAETLSDGRPL
ncbi:flagellar assembly protein FlbE [uncultured Brevundimonas sp.]|uniref:flagellar assembly protein FlbE n=1 Tax=uncultured Brevundimonas sp. TaxID=213418 RepID=UPI0030EF0901